MPKIKVLGVDPGISGAFVLTDGRRFRTWPMPVVSDGKNKLIHFQGVHSLLTDIQDAHGRIHVFLERAVPMAQGAKQAFSYGRGFAALEIAVELLGFSVIYVEASKWTKEMHQGISADLKAKAKSIIAVKRLFPQLVAALPTGKKGAIQDGPVDALLIAAYGLRQLGAY